MTSVLAPNTQRRSPASSDAAPVKPKLFAFIASDADGRSPSNTRRFIRSHVMRGKNTRKRGHGSPRTPTPSSTPSPTDDNADASTTVPSQRTSPVATSEGPEEHFSDSPDHMPYNPSSALSDSLSSCDDGIVEESVSDPVDNVRTSPTTLVCVAKHGINGAPEGVTLRMASLPGPVNFSSSMCAFDFAENIGFDGQQLIHDFFTSLKRSLYPLDLCTSIPDSEDYWFRWLLEDPAYLNSALFNVSIFHDIIARRSLKPSQVEIANVHQLFSPRSWRYLRRTIKLLQERIEDKSTQAKDSTAAVVVSLAMTAELVGDDKAFNIHVEGLKNMVRMRGGLDTFPINSKMQIKICRVDLGWSIKTGAKPQLRRVEDLDWAPVCRPILKEHNLAHVATESTVQPLLSLLDEKLHNIFTDVRDFCCLATFLRSNSRKLSPAVFQEIMVSMQYRLLLLDYNKDPRRRLEEAIRLSLLTFQFTFYRLTPGIKGPYDLLSKQLREALQNVDVLHPMLADLQLWMFFIGSMVVLDSSDPWIIETLAELIGNAEWPEVEHRLRGVVWIDAIHSDAGHWLYKTILEAKPGQAMS
ncbi:hypothetical protein B0I35DRAFT_185908 [Stachybotrys elegans]|uniref:Uncharacterized protein n=1 Tax=Stachybotrys elegans TaxID=80388 RepID=A0A8K0WUL6_9HYPO|nr:hypothetical protein B0I35DRAFT_185908 [Stachybotrys elegans]